MKDKIKIEVCCGSIDDVIVASQHKIDRIELNSALELGGLSPTIATLKASKAQTNLPICCMVRPRTAGFYYSEAQFKVMLNEASSLLENGADGIVFGFLNIDNTIDIKRTKQMVKLIKSYHKEAIFHKAFDETPDLISAAQSLIDCQVDRILTSGGLNYPNIEKGYPILKTLIKQYHKHLEILIGGGINAENIIKTIQETNTKNIHMSAKKNYQDNGEYLAVSHSRLSEILKQLPSNK
ncbi:MAG: copper homeostasis protein CutC [Erysipelotrichaceae bacterium]